MKKLIAGITEQFSVQESQTVCTPAEKGLTETQHNALALIDFWAQQRQGAPHVDAFLEALTDHVRHSKAFIKHPLEVDKSTPLDTEYLSHVRDGCVSLSTVELAFTLFQKRENQVETLRSSDQHSAKMAGKENSNLPEYITFGRHAPTPITNIGIFKDAFRDARTVSLSLSGKRPEGHTSDLHTMANGTYYKWTFTEKGSFDAAPAKLKNDVVKPEDHALHHLYKTPKKTRPQEWSEAFIHHSMIAQYELLALSGIAIRNGDDLYLETGSGRYGTDEKYGVDSCTIKGFFTT